MHALGAQGLTRSMTTEEFGGSSAVNIQMGVEVPDTPMEPVEIGNLNVSSMAPDEDGGSSHSSMVFDDNHCLVTTSPSGATYWTPLCADRLTPKVGQVFETLKDAEKFYKNYAAACIFEVRLGRDVKLADGRIRKKYMFCNKEGQSNAKPRNTLSGEGGRARILSLSRCGCKAAIVLKLVDGTTKYSVADFGSAHNHPLATPSGAHFMKCRRSLSYAQKNLLAACTRANIGPSQSAKLAKEIAGGFENVGAITRDFQNHHRDVVEFIGLNDAQMVIDRFKNRKQNSSEFFFEYCTSENSLSRLFWADPIARRNYRAYGDVVSFDATYALNRYDMVFVPFTGVDNHMNSITFGAGLLSGESKESYTWLLETFMRCMGKAPRVVLTDEDAALLAVIPKVLPNTHHRLCMWHIMMKLPQKIGCVTERQLTFGRLFKNLVYEYHVDTDEFEERWKALMVEFGMTTDLWLIDKFNKRSLWIPCYFKDIPLGGLMRTTSRSESANSFFGGFLKHGMTLLAFMMGFGSAMDSQRHTQSKCDHETRTLFPKIETPLDVEKQAAEIYTCRVFREFQKEILAACYDVSVVRVFDCEEAIRYEIRDSRFHHRTFEVQYTSGNSEFACSCKLFEKVGYLCRHILTTFKSAGVTKLSTKYITERWTRNAIVYANEGLEQHFIDQCDFIHEINKESSNVWLEFKSCMQLVGNDVHRKDQMLSLVKEMRLKLEASADPISSRGKNDIIAEILGASQLRR